MGYGNGSIQQAKVMKLLMPARFGKAFRSFLDI
jgi:hypothetical protein